MNEVQIAKPQEIGGSRPQLPGSWHRVMATAEFDHAQRTVKLPATISDEDLMGLTAILHSHEEAMKPSTPKQRRACLLALVAVYPPRPGDEQTNEVRFNLYHEALRDIPSDVLWEACLECVKTITFFPMPAEILVVAEKRLGERRLIVTRLRAIRDYRVIRETDDPVMSDAERARRRGDADAWRQTIASDAMTEELKREERLAAAVVIVKDEPEISDLATAILRARVSASQARNLDLAFLKEIALADARVVWPWLKARGWSSLQREAVEA